MRPTNPKICQDCAKGDHCGSCNCCRTGKK